MARGRKPKPTALKLITGNPGNRPLNELEPVIVTPDLPEPPAHLSKIAKEEWALVAPALFNCGILSLIDRAALGAYCQAYGRWVMAETELKEVAFVTETSKGTLVQSPLVGIANKAAVDMVRFASEFGMTPSSRTRLSVDSKPPSETSASKYLA